MIIILILLVVTSPCVIGQEYDDDLEEPWYLSLSYNSIYIGEELWANISGPVNSSFTIRFEHENDYNNSFYITGNTNENGSAYRKIRTFQKDEVGFYYVTLIHNEIIKDTININVMYDKDYDQDLKIEDLEKEKDQLWDMINNILQYNRNQDENYLKWFKVSLAFLGTTIFFIMFFGVLLSPAIKFYFRRTDHEENVRMIGWFVNLVFGGIWEKRTFDLEYQGYPSDFNVDKKVPDDIDCKELKPYAGMTDKEIEIERRKKHYGEDYEKEVPYGKYTEEEFNYFEKKKGNLGKILDKIDPWKSDYKNKGGVMKYNPFVIIWLMSTIIISGTYYLFSPHQMINLALLIIISVFTIIYFVVVNKTNIEKDGDE